MSVAPGGTVRSNDHNILFGENGVRVGGATAEVREEELDDGAGLAQNIKKKPGRVVRNIPRACAPPPERMPPPKNTAGAPQKPRERPARGAPFVFLLFFDGRASTFFGERSEALLYTRCVR